MAKKFPIHPPHPERICWGCDKYCSTDAMKCGNGSDRTQHPVELFGDDWLEFGNQNTEPAKKTYERKMMLCEPLYIRLAEHSLGRLVKFSKETFFSKRFFSVCIKNSSHT